MNAYRLSPVTNDIMIQYRRMGMKFLIGAITALLLAGPAAAGTEKAGNAI